MKKKNMTIDDLARMVQKGFAETASREQFSGLEDRIEGLEAWAKGRFDNVEKKLDRIEKKLKGWFI